MNFSEFTAKKAKALGIGSHLGTEENQRHDKKLPAINNVNFNHETEKHIEDLKSGNNNILVAVRARPLNAREQSISNFETIRVLDRKMVVILDPSNHFEANDVLRNNRNKEKQYAFDFAFDQSVGTEEIFENTTKFLIPGVLNGFNATIFAYGATGAGKTYTMLGDVNKVGIMLLTMNELFNQVQRNLTNKEFTIKISYLEVYNETLRDLLSGEDNVLDLREEAGRGVVVSGVTEVIATTSQEVMTLLKIGGKNRTMEPTGANVVSSRSHAVLQVTVEHKDKNQGISEEITISKLSLIDLAGSERASNTNNRGQRLIEGANINKSLLALGNCITLLSDKVEKGGGKITHIPYRDSKLTRLLKDSLGGNCRTVMITNVSPGVICFEDTLNTLKYANRAKNIKTTATRNVLNVENHVEKYAQIISDLKSENDHLKKLLQNGQNKHHPHDGLLPMQRETGVFVVNDALVSDIRYHFEEEIKIKKKIFDMELQQDEIEDKMLMMKNEMNIAEDKVLKDRFEEYASTQKRLPHQIEDLKRDFGYLSGKRNQIIARIQNEKHKDSITFLTSIFKQNQMIIENMDLAHKEKRVENQVRLKDRQIKYLQSQLGMREFNKAKSVVSQYAYSNVPSRIIQDTPLGTEPIHGSETQEDSFSFLHDFDGIDHSSPVINLKLESNAKNALYLPNVAQKLKHSGNYPNRKAVPPKRGRVDFGNLSDKTRHNSVKSLPPSKPQSKYYYNKQDFIMQKNKPFRAPNGDEPKTRKKYGYVPNSEKLQKDHPNTNVSMRENNDSPNKLRPRGLSFDKGNKGNDVKSLIDLSHDSTAPSSKHTENKKNILEDLNKRKDGLPKITKSKALNYANLAHRYKESPYVMKPKW